MRRDRRGEGGDRPVRIAVCLQWVPDPASVETDPLTGRVRESRVVHRLNPADRGALGEAIRLRGLFGGQVAAFTVGPPAHEEALREAAAVGADTVLRVWEPELEGASPATVGAVLAEAIRPARPDVVLLGTASVHWGSGEVPVALAEALGLPAVTGVCALDILPGAREAVVQRKLERGEREVLACDLPAVFAVEPDIAEPPYAPLPGVLDSFFLSVPLLALRPPAASGAPEVVSPASARLGPPRPRPRAIFTPDPRAPVWRRVEQIVSGGRPKKSGAILEGPPEWLAEHILAYLRQHDLL